jgi:outer membrane protein TolC
MKKLFFIGFLCSVFSVNAQDTLVLSHNNLVQITLSQNLQIQSNELKFKLAKVSFYKSIGKALPTLGMGIKRYELSGYTQSTEGAFEDVDKNKEWNGKSFRLSWDLSELLFNSAAKNQSIKAAFYNKETGNIDEQIMVYIAYYKLVASQEKEKAIISFIQKNEEIVAQLQLQVSAGLRLQSELLLAQSNFNNLKIKLLQQAQNSKELSQKLLATLNVEGNFIIKTDCDFYINNPTPINDYNLEEKLNNRFELQELRSEVSAMKWKKNRELYGLLLPQISFGMNDGLLGPINQDAFGNQKIMTTSLMWSIPLGNIFPAGNYKTESSLYKLKTLEKAQLKNELRAEMNTIIAGSNSANEQYELAKQSAEYAKLAYEQSLQRQELGTTTQLELFHAEKEYLNARLVYIGAIAYKQEMIYKNRVAFSEKVKQ